MKIRVGVGLGTTATAGLDGEGFWRIVDACEEQRWDSLWLSERVAADVPDPLAAMAAVAGRTHRLKFGPSVLVLPGRNPVLLAKELATIDVLSGGRLVVAFGLGSDVAPEHGIFGVPRSERAARTEEATELIVKLWTSEDVVFEGRFFRVDGLTLRPKPVQTPHPDVWFGGHSAPACRRVGRYGTGWLPSFLAPSEYAARVDLIREEAAAAGREIEEDHYGALVPYVPEGVDPDGVLGLVRERRPDVDPLEIVAVGGDGRLRDLVSAFVEEGATKFVVVPVAPPADWVEELSRLRESVVRPLEN